MSFRRHAHAEQRKQSIVIFVKEILELSGLYPAHRRSFLKTALSKYTEGEGGHKHKTRFRSKASYAAGSKLRHDHVYQRARMVDLLMAQPENVEAILSSAVGCTITKEEHAGLDNYRHLDGWERYREAGIVIVDTETEMEWDDPRRAAQRRRKFCISSAS